MKALCKLLKPGTRLASMGYPDMIARPKEVEVILGSKIYGLKYRDDSDEIARWHTGEERKIPDAKSFFSLLDVELDVYDVVSHRGGEIIRDLNHPFPKSDLAKYDFVVDVGTLEHCFNIGQAASNMAGLLKKGGVILHENPFNWANHGFYNLNPTWYFDFYSQPGFRVMDVIMVTHDGKQVENVAKTARFTCVGIEANMFACATRTEVMPITWPVQSKYRGMIPQAKEASHG